MKNVQKLNARHLLFINEMIRHGDKLKAYATAYPDARGEALRKAAERLMKNPAIAQQIDEVRAQIRHEAYVAAYAACMEDMKTELLSMQKRRAILAQLATCEMKVGRYVKYNGDYVMVYEDPRPRDIIRAIELDTKLEEACNTARRAEEKELSRYDIYIDGRPCDNPTAPVKTDIPMGLVMLPKKTPKKLHTETEQNGTKRSEFTGTNEKDIDIEVTKQDAAGRGGEDILGKSLYKNYKQRIAAIPPREPLTNIEIKQIREQISNTKPKYSTYGKLPPKPTCPQPGDMSIHKADYSPQL